MSTTRPLAREMTGTSRETSGKTVPVAFSSWGNSTLFGGGERELGDIVLVDGDQVHVGHLDDLCRRRSAVALILASCSRPEPRAAMRQARRLRRNGVGDFRGSREHHGITSRPTARFSCPAAFR